MPAAHDFPGTWYHLIATVYGAWLYGDPRGFRTRHHREHVDGDYKHPPPAGKYDRQFIRSQARLKQEPVVVPVKFRMLIGQAIRQRLEKLGAYVLCLAVSGQHVHALVKLPDDADPRDLLGRAKKHASFEIKRHGWRGKLWGKRGKEMPLRDRPHQRNVYRYVLAHAGEGAWVYDALKKSE